MKNNEVEDSISDINVTPFVDILLVLLIIFMICAPAMTRSVGVSLPKSKLINGTAEQAAALSKSIVIGLNEESRVIFQSKRFTLDHFFERYQELIAGKEIDKVYIQADKTVPYNELLHLMVFLKNQGHENIGLVFDQKK